MTPTSPHGQQRAAPCSTWKHAWVSSVTTAGLAVAALAHPLLDVLAEQPTFFAAHKADAQALILFAAAATVATATGGAVVAAILRLVGGRAGNALSVAVFGCLVALICDRIGRQMPALHEPYVVLSSAVVGTVVAVAQSRSATVRFTTTVVGCAALVLVPAYFLTRALPSVSAGSDSAEYSQFELQVARPAPIVFVILDALRLLELLDDDGRIDENAFPNFARLSREATWYRNTTTVAGFTSHAVPALLTGEFPPPHSNMNRAEGPTLAAHPANLFTMLAGAYDTVAEQPITDLCPPRACEQLHDHRQILAELLSDSAALLPYVFGTPSYVATLPKIDTKWAGFALSTYAAASGRKLERARSWVDAVDVGETPRLYFLHTLTPHKPLRYTADGRRYEEPEPRFRSSTSYDGYQWTEDVATVEFEHARYRMQSAAVDGLLGRLIERLEHLGVYDETLLVVTSDHGVAFTPGKSHRHYDESLQAELFFVPLFIKAPAQTEGKIDDRPAQSIDVLPTILDMIGAGPVEVDGRSLVDEHERPAQRFFVPPGRRDRVAVSDTGPSSLPPRRVREANEHRPVTDATEQISVPRPERNYQPERGTTKNDTVIVLPPIHEVTETTDATGQDRAYFLHGFVMLDDPSAGWPLLELSLDGGAVLLTGTFFGRETGRIVFEAIVQSREPPDVVHATIDAALRWANADGTQKRTSPRIVRSREESALFLTTANAFWYAFWQGHAASISCSEDYRRAFLTAWRETAEDSQNVFSLARLIRRTSAICGEDDEAVAGPASDPQKTCTCDILESELTTPPSNSAKSRVRAPNGSPAWDTQWGGFAFATKCTDLVKQRFGEFYHPEGEATWVRPPFVLLRAAIESCRHETSIGSGADPTACACFPFDWADGYDAQWAKRWDYTDAANGPKLASGAAVVEASKITGEGPRR